MAAVANQSNTSGGILADKLGWVSFFILTTAATIPALALLVWIARRSAIHVAAVHFDERLTADSPCAKRGATPPISSVGTRGPQRCCHCVW